MNEIKEYLKTVKQFNYWKAVKCMTKGRIDPPEVIHDRIWTAVKKYI